MLAFSNDHRLPLAMGDGLTFLAFAALGRRAHSMGSALDDVVATALPFALAWFLVAPFTGAFGAQATGDPGSAARRAAWTWLFAFPLGWGIRVLILGRRVPHISFTLVAGFFTLLFLVGWRSVFAQVRQPRETGPDR